MKGTINNLFLAFLIYSPTLILLPQSIMYLIISFIGGLYFLSDIKNNKLYKQDIIFLVFVGLSLIVYTFLDPVAKTESRSLNEFVPYSIFFLTTIFFARHLNRKIIFYVFCFICFEIFVGIGEYVVGRPYIIKPAVTGETEFGESELLYFNRVFGLSQAVSIFGYKIMIGFLLLFYLNIKKYKLWFLGLLIVGLFINFNRTAIIGSIIFLAVHGLLLLKNLKIGYKLLLFISTFILLYIVYDNFTLIEYQFFRGREGDLSGREDIFPYFINFIENNLLLGNNFHKMWGNVSGRSYHAHNSYLQTLANMGVIFFVFLWIYLLTFFKKINIKYLIPIMIYSIFQYGILWGVSFLDIIFFYFLMNKEILLKGEQISLLYKKQL